MTFHKGSLHTEMNRAQFLNTTFFRAVSQIYQNGKGEMTGKRLRYGFKYGFEHFKIYTILTEQKFKMNHETYDIYRVSVNPGDIDEQLVLDGPGKSAPQSSVGQDLGSYCSDISPPPQRSSRGRLKKVTLQGLPLRSDKISQGRPGQVAE